MTPIDDQFAEAVNCHQRGDLPGAEQLYRAILEANPGHAGALTNLGVLITKSGKLEEAADLYKSAIASNPRQLDAHFNLGNLYRKLNRPQDAALAFHAALRLDPNHARSFNQLGLVALDLGDGGSAIECFRKAIAHDVGLAEAYNLLGDTLTRMGQVDEALPVFREFVTRYPEDPRGHHNLGLALGARGDFDDAIVELELALKLRPDYPEAHNALGIFLEGTGRTDEAQQHYLDAVERKPEFADAWSNLGTSLTEQGRVSEAIRALRKSQSLRADARSGSNLLLALTFTSAISAEQLRDEHASWGKQFAKPLTPSEPTQPHDPRSNRRLKIGYIGGDFRQHPASRFIEVLLTHHDRNAVHITCYSNVNRPDDITQRLRRLADAWCPVASLSDAAVVEKVRADEIDVLVDLSGHTAGNRLLAMARRPAALQVSLSGYPCTTGLEAIDFRISDPSASPPSCDQFSVEPILRLPEVGWVYTPPEAAPEANALPSESRRTFTFGCLNNPAKLSDQCIETWAAILKAVPRSRLVLMSGHSTEGARTLSERFTQQGIATDRLELVYRLPANEYLEAYQPIDLCLDPFPFNGMQTTCDSLWMGAPVLTVAGADTRSRQGVSIMNHLGLPEFAADSPEKLVELAAIWSEQRAGLADLRSSLREMMQQSPVTQAIPFVRHLERVLREKWLERASVLH